MKLFEHEKHAAKSLNFSLKPTIIQLFWMYVFQFQDPGNFMPENNSVITCAWTQHSTTWLKFFFIWNVPALKLLCPFFPHCTYIWYKHVFEVAYYNLRPKTLANALKNLSVAPTTKDLMAQYIQRLKKNGGKLAEIWHRLVNDSTITPGFIHF